MQTSHCQPRFEHWTIFSNFRCRASRWGLAIRAYRRENGEVRQNLERTLSVYFHDTWKLHERLTLNYGLGWSFDGNLNYDLSKPWRCSRRSWEPAVGTNQKTMEGLLPGVGTSVGTVRRR